MKILETTLCKFSWRTLFYANCIINVFDSTKDETIRKNTDIDNSESKSDMELLDSECEEVLELL